MPIPEDRSLLDSFRQGEGQALSVVYREYACRVYEFLRGGFTFRSGGQALRFNGYRKHADLEDRMQEVFEKAFSQQARLSYDGFRPYWSFLAAIVKNAVIDELRKREALFERMESESGTGALEEDDELSEPSAGPEENAEEKELLSLVADFVAGLNPSEAAVFSLRFKERKTLMEASAALGVPVHRIRAAEAKIKKMFFRFMKSRGYFEGLGEKETRRLIILAMVM